jgi:hypothetical protein
MMGLNIVGVWGRGDDAAGCQRIGSLPEIEYDGSLVAHQRGFLKTWGDTAIVSAESAPNQRELRALTARDFLPEFPCIGQFLPEPVCNIVPDIVERPRLSCAPQFPDRQTSVRIPQYRYAPPPGAPPTACLASSVRLVKRLQCARLCRPWQLPSSALRFRITLQFQKH